MVPLWKMGSRRGWVLETGWQWTQGRLTLTAIEPHSLQGSQDQGSSQRTR